MPPPDLRESSRKNLCPSGKEIQGLSKLSSNGCFYIYPLKFTIVLYFFIHFFLKNYCFFLFSIINLTVFLLASKWYPSSLPFSRCSVIHQHVLNLSFLPNGLRVVQRNSWCSSLTKFHLFHRNLIILFISLKIIEWRHFSTCEKSRP